MSMPLDIILIRHGESEGNVAVGRSKKGDNSDFTQEFYNRHSSSWRLTNKGVEQAKAAGTWVKNNIGTTFNKYYTSEYLRAMETAALLDLPEAIWKTKFYLRERDLGTLDVRTREERAEHFPEYTRALKISAFYATPNNGESMATLCLRLGKILDTLQREASEGKAIIVCHGEVIKAFRLILERIPVHKFEEIDSPKNPADKIRNCQILHYTRRNPGDAELISANYMWKRSVCPWDVTRESLAWQKIIRPVYTNEELLRIANETSRQISE